MTVKERILMIRLMENLQKHPTYAKALVLEVAGVTKSMNDNK